MHLNNNSLKGLRLRTSVQADGRINLNLSRSHRSINSLFSESEHTDYSKEETLAEESDSAEVLSKVPELRHLCIVIQVVGSRGDVQPFIALGLTLSCRYGHRVRIATHAAFKTLVEQHSLEFFDIGGNPEQLMAYMVQNPGLLPSLSSLKGGAVQEQRNNMRAILEGCWRSCIETTGSTPFVVDAIIANPPSFAHIHCAERLGVPLHIMFTMPYSPTTAFPHPLAKIGSSEFNSGFTNKLSFALMDQVTWCGLGDLVNKFRESLLGLRPVSLAWAPGMIARLRIPHTYCWSPTLLKKPKDWGPEISVSGFYFLPRTYSFEPPADLWSFINAGEPPIYIGFGSIIFDDPQSMMEMILAAIEQAGVRALISEGWTRLGTESLQPSDNVFVLGDVPHSWLFEHVSAVIHHGGAGTTAAGIAAGKPTIIVPFFGDGFWGDVVANAGAGPPPIAYSDLTASRLANQIQRSLQPDVKLRALHLRRRVEREQGIENGARHFHKMLFLDGSQCALTPERRAVWRIKNKDIKLSAMAAALLCARGLIKQADIILHRPRQYDMKDLPTDPITGGALAFLGSFNDVVYEICNLSRQIARDVSDGAPQSAAKDLVATAVPEDAYVLQSLEHSNARPHQALRSEGESLEAGRNKHTHRLVTGKKVTLTLATGVGRLGKAVLESPMHFSMGIARGFQSIPIAYGDKSGREPENVTGLIKGIEVGGKELVYGFYEGITGVVTQPMRGSRESGAAGFAKGLGRGLGGLILKPGAGLFGLPAYSLQGLSQGVQNLFGVDYEKLITQGRIDQGNLELREASESDKLRVLRAWKEVSWEV